MMMHTQRISRRMLLAVSVLAALLLVSPAALARPHTPRVLPPNSQAFGKSYGEWGAAYMRWWLTQPDAATDCAQGQQGKVWFLPALPTNSEDLTLTVACTIPTGTAVLIPILTGAGNTAAECERGDPNAPELGPGAIGLLEQIGGFSKFTLTVDGKEISNLGRYRIEPTSFPETPNPIPPPATVSVACGFWVLLAPLPPGEHTIHLTVNLENLGPDIGPVDLTWTLTVLPRGQQR
jgi:hypothetical protein